jgi:hypothetical protein
MNLMSLNVIDPSVERVLGTLVMSGMVIANVRTS